MVRIYEGSRQRAVELLTQAAQDTEWQKQNKTPDLLSFSLKCVFILPPPDLVPCFCDSWLPLLGLARLRWRRTGEILPSA